MRALAQSEPYVKTIIKELATQNFDSYPQDYKIEDGKATEETAINILSLAENYWDHRSDDEIERDENLNLDKEDYAVWCEEAFRDWLEN